MLARIVGVVSQETYLVHASIRENLLLAAPDATEAELWRALGAAQVADLVAPVLGWSDEQRALEVEHYRKRVEAELESQQMPDDATADAARLGAADVVPLA